MDIILLRKLTLKSILNFGEYFDYPIWKLLELQKYSYLRWVYFNCSNITFTDDILELLKITDEYKISKPGVNRELGIEFKNLMLERFLFCKANIKRYNKYSKIVAIRSKVRTFNKDKIIFSKASLARYNHGHR